MQICDSRLTKLILFHADVLSKAQHPSHPSHSYSVYIWAVKGAFDEHFFLGQRLIVTATMAIYFRSHIATKRVKETMSKNLC